MLHVLQRSCGILVPRWVLLSRKGPKEAGVPIQWRMRIFRDIKYIVLRERTPRRSFRHYTQRDCTVRTLRSEEDVLRKEDR